MYGSCLINFFLKKTHSTVIYLYKMESDDSEYSDEYLFRYFGMAPADYQGQNPSYYNGHRQYLDAKRQVVNKCYFCCKPLRAYNRNYNDYIKYSCRKCNIKYIKETVLT